MDTTALNVYREGSGNKLFQQKTFNPIAGQVDATSLRSIISIFDAIKNAYGSSTSPPSRT